MFICAIFVIKKEKKGEEKEQTATDKEKINSLSSTLRGGLVPFFPFGSVYSKKQLQPFVVVKIRGEYFSEKKERKKERKKEKGKVSPEGSSLSPTISQSLSQRYQNPPPTKL